MKNEKSAGGFNNLLAVYSFILTVIVIWIHSGDVSAQGEVYGLVHKFFSETLGQMAVPGFFIISGYLFFRNISQNDMNGKVPMFFIKQWRKRSRSLLIPYLIWNAVYMAVYVAFGRAGLNAGTLVDGLLFYRFNPVFWYIYQLIILTLLSPVVYYLVKEKRMAIFSIAALFVLAVFYDRLPVHIVNEDAFLYYSLGAALSLHAKGFIESEIMLPCRPLPDKKNTPNEENGSFKPENGVYEKESAIWLMILGISVTAIGICSYLKTLTYPLFGVILLRIVMNICLFSALKLLKAESFRIYPFMKQTFFIYAMHYMEIRLFRIILTSVSVEPVLLFIIMPALCVAISFCLGASLKKIVPRFYELICGGR